VTSNGSRTIHFSIFELDLQAGELRRNGSKIRLQEQPFQILLSLLERPGEVISREKLRTKLWPADTFVDFDHSLNAAVRRLRDALGDSADTPRFVETVARRGYRFIAPINKAAVSSEVPLVQAKQGHSRRWWGIVAGSSALLIVGLVAGFHAGQSRSSSQAPTSRRLTANPSEIPVLGQAISHDGTYLAFADTSGFYIRQIDTGETHALSLPKGFDARPAAWFPDGTHLLATWVDDPRRPPSIWQVSVVGGEPRKLIDQGRSPSISPDGSHIAFLAGPETKQEIWVAQSDGQKPHRVSASDGTFVGQLAWSPSAGRIAFVSGKYEHDMYADTRIATINLASGHQAFVFTQAGLGPGLIWTSDNRLLFSLHEPSPSQDDSNVWSVGIDEATGRISGPRHRITSAPGYVGDMTVSGDGRRLSLAKYTLQPDVYVAELRGELKLSTPRRLTLDDRTDFPYAWTPDSKAVIFGSDRDGPYHVFKQAFNSTEPELLVGGPEDATLPRLSSDSSTVLFLSQPLPRDATRKVKLMSVPLAGGPPQLVLEAQNINNHQCARMPSTLCIYSVIGRGEQKFYGYDWKTGRQEEIAIAKITDSDPYTFNWSLSPDGELLASAKKMGPEKELVIRLLSLPDASERLLQVQAWAGIGSLDWAADGRSLWAMAYTTKDTWALLNISVSGTVTKVLEEKNLRLGWAIPSPDGKRLALWEASGSANVWMLENF
jgi:DNA-binding winged helix-turn-helix (wHTH) protein/Tol biopolymer transport system component